MSFTSDEVNILVHRYLVECGYSHAAFTFYNEGMYTLRGGRDIKVTSLCKHDIIHMHSHHHHVIFFLSLCYYGTIRRWTWPNKLKSSRCPPRGTHCIPTKGIRVCEHRRAYQWGMCVASICRQNRVHMLHIPIPQDGSMKQCEEPFTLITPHICTNIRKAESKLRKGKVFFA